jgi:hypothetical protein
MSVSGAVMFWSAVALYFGIGLLFALLFVFAGASRIDHAAGRARLPFRLVIIPGAALLWPLMLLMWMAGAGANNRDKS